MKPDEVDPRSGVRIVGGDVGYADGSEQRLLDVLEAAGDRRTASDELAAHVVDWPSRYHLSRLRANLLRPLGFGAGMRVLDVGAGMGALARHLGETGADVVALEGTLDRARAAAARCEGLDNVEVVCGPVESFSDDEGFDAVVCVGVLEYAGARAGELLARLRSLTRDDGALVVAIENQVGLRYLLGYGEDHLGEPWVGVEGYLADPAVRTYSRRRLAELLGGAGFAALHWLFPYPDYKLPSAVVDQSAFDRPDAATFVDRIVGWPCSAEASQPLRLCDDRWAHRVFLDAGLGPDVANSFLVVAAAESTGVERLVDGDTAAWFFGRERSRVWLRSKRFPAVRGSGQPEVEVAPIDPGAPERRQGWLRQAYDRTETLVEGPSVEQLALEALLEGPEAVAEVLRRWRRHLAGLEGDATAEPEGSPPADHPFRSGETTRVLPSDHLDVDLSNFVVGADGALVLVDREWAAPSAVDALLVQVRALWWFATELVQHGISHPWPRHATVDELTETLGLLCGLPVSTTDVDRWRDAEARLQSKVVGEPVAQLRTALADLGGTSQFTPAVFGRLPFTVLRRDLAEATANVSVLREAVAAEQSRGAEATAALTAQRDAAQEAFEATRAHAEMLQAALADSEARRAEVERVLAEANARWEGSLSGLAARVGRRLLGLVGRR
ncbi:MAG TPA: methyltransferase domain-containing protein [Acidimicrobiales bacterium]|nr:methyltransferase domain-containing protein [Acidimicrobiales bacterium]